MAANFEIALQAIALTAMATHPSSAARSAGPTGRIGLLCQRYVRFAAHNAGWILFAALILGAAATTLAVRLELRTDLAELLPSAHPAVQAVRRIAGRQKSATNLVLILDCPDAAANKRFWIALKPELEKLVPSVFSQIQWKPDDEIPTFAAKWKWLYADMKELERSEALLDRSLARRKSPLFIDLEGDAEAELTALRKEIDAKLPTVAAQVDASAFSKNENGINSLGIMMWRQRDGFGTMGDHQTLNAVKDVVAKVNPSAFHSELKVLYTGHIAMAISEQKTIQDNITLATLVCITLIMLVIYLHFRRIGILFVIALPAIYGVLLSLALAEMTIQYLNINTAFLISIILGNGINAPIVLLARYGEERTSGYSVDESITRAMTNTMLGTATAMLAASIAYASLMFTDFRGFSQFGLIGGSGMVLVWIATMLFVPPLLVRSESRFAGIFTPKPSLWHVPFSILGRLLAKRPIMIALGACGLVVVALFPLRPYLADPIEWNFNNLRSDDGENSHLWSRMESIGMANLGAGYIGNNGVLLVDKPEQADIVAQAMRQADAARGDKHTLAVVRTLNAALPADQVAKLELLSRIRNKLDKNRDIMSEQEWIDVSGFRPPDYLRLLTVNDLPRLVVDAFTEVDGQRGRLIGIDADYANYTDWNGHDLIRLSESLRVEALGQTWIAASAGSVFAGMVETIHKDGPRVTAVALGGVLLLVCTMFRFWGALPVLLATAVGMVWLGGMLGWLQIKLNFMNFVTLPITLGVGSDYAANIWARLRREGSESIRRVILETGSAVALCSATTIIGYSTLLLADNRALRSFGKAADIGEIACLLAAFVVLPAMAVLFTKRPASGQPT